MAFRDVQRLFRRGPVAESKERATIGRGRTPWSSSFFFVAFVVFVVHISGTTAAPGAQCRPTVRSCVRRCASSAHRPDSENPENLENPQRTLRTDATIDSFCGRGVYAALVARALRQWLAACGAVLAALAPLAAHHAVAAKFDSAKKVTLRGPVTAIDWANPHAHVFVNVAGPGGRVANWAIELESPVDLRRQGWTRNAVNIGDVVTVEGIAARDGSNQAWSLSIVVAGTGQRVFFPRQVAAPAATHKPTPRWPDGQPRLGAVPGETGYWSAPSATTLVERGIAVEADANGLLRSVADAPRVAPFQDWARDLYIYRQRALLKDDPMFLRCLPPGGPRQFQSRFGVQFL